MPEKTAANSYYIDRGMLPPHCPTDEMALWNTHPRVYLSLSDSGEARCPYCGTHFMLKEKA